MDIRLLVLRTSEPEKLAEFYGLLGINFEYHKHGNSPFHFSAMVAHTTLEIYPLTKGQIEADKNMRLGFGIDDFEATIEYLKEKEVVFSAEPTHITFLDQSAAMAMPRP